MLTVQTGDKQIEPDPPVDPDPPAEGIIQFKDPAVKALCVANWDRNGDGELSVAEAADVMDLGRVLKAQTLCRSTSWHISPTCVSVLLPCAISCPKSNCRTVFLRFQPAASVNAGS